MKIHNLIISALTILMLLACNQENQHSVATSSLKIGFQENGVLNALIDIQHNRNYVFQDSENALMAIQVAGRLEYPASMSYDEVAKTYQLTYAENKITARIKEYINDRYLSFELIELSEMEAVELVLWGPFKTAIKETIGETIGVVRNQEFAIGIQALNPRTLGGTPSSDDSTPSYNIFGTTSLVDVSDSLNIL